MCTPSFLSYSTDTSNIPFAIFQRLLKSFRQYLHQEALKFLLSLDCLMKFNSSSNLKHSFNFPLNFHSDFNYASKRMKVLQDLTTLSLNQSILVLNTLMNYAHKVVLCFLIKISMHFLTFDNLKFC